jgi:hypothetical protein
MEIKLRKYESLKSIEREINWVFFFFFVISTVLGLCVRFGFFSSSRSEISNEDPHPSLPLSRQEQPIICILPHLEL